MLAQTSEIEESVFPRVVCLLNTGGLEPHEFLFLRRISDGKWELPSGLVRCQEQVHGAMKRILLATIGLESDLITLAFGYRGKFSAGSAVGRSHWRFFWLDESNKPEIHLDPTLHNDSCWATVSVALGLPLADDLADCLLRNCREKPLIPPD